MWRSYFLTFTGPTVVDAHGHEPEEQPRAITVVLILLAVGAFVLLFLGIPALFMGSPPAMEHYLAPVFAVAEELPKVYPQGTGHLAEGLLMAASVGIAFLGLGLAWWLYRGRQSKVPEALLARFPRIHRVVYNKYYVDELYQATAVRGFMTTARASSWFDAHILDGLVNLAGAITRLVAIIDGAIDKYVVDGLVNGLASATRAAGRQLRRLQTGKLPAYLAGLAAGALLLAVLTKFLMDLAGGE